MSSEANLMMKKILQKISDALISQNKYNSLRSVTIFFVFGSSHKTAMCQFVYGMKVSTDLPFNKRVDIIREFQLELKKLVEKKTNTFICATDVVVES